ncbi:transcriptional regulator, TetR family [Prevotella aff. ruminicola Tc2-24]|uniref:Transcriptional regulator, TetR family n=2 Tax=Prevotella aff. ruminicola Tc2-24 TaxID=81582 RepID=A0A1I0MAU4_9BACT|nr:transcriptional regulator, TetR family [Prevotella aff. ruminicola Tc2-24]
MNMQETKEISAYKQGLRGKILETAMNAFGEKGIRAVKMDDVAVELGISKRTLYELYDNKEQLLFEGVKVYNEQRQILIKEKTKNCGNVMEILLTVYRIKVEEFRQTNPLFYADLVKYPKVARFLHQQNQYIHTEMQKFIQRGVSEGFFREDVDEALTMHLFDALGEYVMMNQLYRRYTIEDIFKNIIFVSLRGICTEKGVVALDRIIG